MSVIKHPKLDKLEAAAAEALKASLSEQQLFSVAPFDEEEVERTGSSDYSYWRSTLRAFRHNWVAMLLLVLLAAILLFTFIQPYLPGQFSPTAVTNGENGLPLRNRQPDGVHYDDEGYDRLAAAVSEAVLAALRERQKRRAAATAPASASP